MAKRKGSSRQKHVPLRTCIACRETKPKRALIRVVLVPDRGLVIDETGKLNGRGAYLCRCADCWEQALKRGSLSQALKAQLAPEDVASLKRYADVLAESERAAEPESAEDADDMV